MLIIFFIIVFIAELIVADKAISWLKQQNKFVCEINQQITDIKPVIANSMKSAKNGVKIATEGVGNLSKFVMLKKRQSIIIAVKILVSGALVIILKKLPNKKVFTAVDMLFTFANLLKL